MVGEQCPDLTGTWRVQHVREFSQSAFGRAIGPKRPRFDWQTLTIAGDTRDSLIITTRRSDSLLAEARAWSRARGLRSEHDAARLQDPAVRWADGAFFEMTDAEYADNLGTLTLPGARTHVLRRGGDYSCDNGRVVSPRGSRGGSGNTDSMAPEVMPGVVATGRNAAGDLVFEGRYRERVTISLWAASSNAIPLGTWAMHSWSRLTPAPPLAPSTAPRPWAEPFVHPYPLGDRDDGLVSVMAPAAVDTIMRSVIGPTMDMDAVERRGRAFRTVVRATSTDSLARMLRRLRQTHRFTTIQVAGLSGAPGRWAVEVRLAPALAPSTMSAEALRDRVVQLLGREVRVDSIRARGDVASLYLVCTGRGAWQRAIDALSRTKAIELTGFSFDRLDPGDVSRGWVAVSERRELYRSALQP
ncbi:MAG: hypothetical protein MUE41_06900 [Gemmatimonadaceae bacterium]|nr:hypothetical protein [Gemmatimonadaceae bacterium]